MTFWNRINCFLGSHKLKEIIEKPYKEEIIDKYNTITATYVCEHCNYTFGNVFWNEVSSIKCTNIFNNKTIVITDFRHNIHKKDI